MFANQGPPPEKETETFAPKKPQYRERRHYEVKSKSYNLIGSI